ncbi:MAG: hypothetical protein DRI44_07130 [Chlamydiae bacterium]|nr:MAG: hypothetical protein DRI44_07130 [Chlamydiota bacterium]
MKIKTTISLVIICIIIGGSFLFFSKKNNRITASGYLVGSKIFTSFPVNEIVKFTITDATNSISLEKKNGVWIVDNYYDYPADFNKIVNLLKKIYNLKVGQTIRVRKESFRKLKLLEPSNSSAQISEKGIMIQFFENGGISAARLLIGKPKYGKANNPYGYSPPIGQYVLLPDESLTELQSSKDKDNIILINDAFNLILSSETWIKRNLFNVKSDTIKEIKVTTPDKNVFVLSRTNKTETLTLKNIKSNEKTKASEINSLISALQFFNIEKVVNPEIVSSNKLMENAWTYFTKTFGGTKYELKISNTNLPNAYVQVKVDYEKPPVESVASNIAENVNIQMQFETPENARKLNQLFAGRTYKISNNTAGKLRKSRTDIIDIIEKIKPKKIDKNVQSAKSAD